MPQNSAKLAAASQLMVPQAGLTIMQQGGNAVDAAIYTASTLPVLETTSNGINCNS
ncbi:gamma-glutamyltransferase [Halobacillus karajensis]|uniref:gamma-glutamyltransferase n=1 Tax=Halobacillus karajensis TaxID=195088 RepID=UPI001E57C1BC|nr:gamma-glutamyltransferase [Halobacillus karajensis]